VTRDALRSLALAIVVLLACRQITLRGASAPNPAYRAQVDALLAGRLAISPSPDGLVHDLAWTPTGTQQVWGLGVPVWQAGFEAIGRALGVAPVPDRLALAAWLALAWLALIRALRPPAAGDAPGWAWVGAWPTRWGALALTALLPGVVSLLRGRIGVYEEAAIYAYGAEMILLAGVIGVGRAGG
jgi:hypothetical protein